LRTWYYLQYAPHHLDLPPFPTRRSSDLWRRPSRAVACTPTPASTPCGRSSRTPRASRPSSSPTPCARRIRACRSRSTTPRRSSRSEEHTSELQSRGHLVCRLLLEKKKKN